MRACVLRDDLLLHLSITLPSMRVRLLGSHLRRGPSVILRIGGHHESLAGNHVVELEISAHWGDFSLSFAAAPFLKGGHVLLIRIKLISLLACQMRLLESLLFEGRLKVVGLVG
jgi:hypothetical protein